MTQFELEPTYERWRTIILEHKTLLTGVIVGLLVGGSMSYVSMRFNLSNKTNILNGEISTLQDEIYDLEDELCTKTGQYESLEQEKEELQATIHHQGIQITSLENLIDDLTESMNTVGGDVTALTNENQQLKSTIQQKNVQISSLQNVVDDLSGTLTEYESQIQIGMVSTGTEWNEPGDYVLNSSFPRGYNDDFLVIYEIKNLYHSSIYRIAIDCYIISGGTIYDEQHYSSIGSIPYDGDWYQSLYSDFDISTLSNGYYTAIITVTDLITGESNAKAHPFEITIS
jgi:predicted nuclease with TOPRIM domain